MARILINRREEADGDISVPLNFQAQDIQNLDSRMANYSMSGNMPDTARNRALLDFADNLAALTSYAYLQIPARLVEDGNDLIGSNGYMIINRYVKGVGFDVSFYSGNFDFFEDAKAYQLSSLTITEPIWRMIDILAGLTPANVWWPVINWCNGPSSYFDDNIGGGYGVVDARFLYPAVKVDYLLSLVETALGYTFSGLPTTAASIPMMGQKANAAVEGLLMYGSASEPAAFSFGATLPDDHHFHNYQTIVNHFGQYELFMYLTVGYTHYNVKIPGKYKLKLVCELQNIGTAPTYLERIEFFAAYCDGALPPYIYDGLFSQWETVPYGGGWTAFTIETPYLDLVALDKVTIGVHAVSTDDYGNTGATRMDIRNAVMTISAVDDIENTTWGYTFPIVENLPQWSAWDLLKTVCQMYQLIPTVDYHTKTVTFRNYSEWYTKQVAGTIYDWSDKLDLSENPQVEYSLDFAQENDFIYKEDSSNGVQGLADGSFLISDKTLPAQKTIVESAFACTDETPHFAEQVNVAHINCRDDSGVFSQGYEPRILKHIQRTAALVLTEPGYLSPTQATWYTGTMVGLTWTELLSDNYNEVTDLITNKTKLLRCFIYLTPLDIATLDITKPVYLKAFGKCFIINKIINYLPGKSTEVELIRM